MVTKLKRANILNNITKKEDRIKISNIIDKCNKAEATYKIVCTNFIDLSLRNTVINILEHEKVKYVTYFPNKDSEKMVILFFPDYIEKLNYSDYVACIKIQPKAMAKLKHKDFMGSIYSLGVKDEFIGDIFLTDKAGFVFVCKSIESYILENLYKVKNQSVVCSKVELDSKECLNLKLEYIPKDCIIPSHRIDALLAEVYNLSRKETKDKIIATDLYINGCLCINPAFEFKENDIVSFRKCGKFMVGQTIRKTKSGNVCIKVFRYK